MNKKRIALAPFCTSVLMLLTSCGVLDSQIQKAVAQTQTAAPTITPYPTFTPLPAATPITAHKIGDEVIGARWKVKVTKVEMLKEYATFSPRLDTSRMIVLTVEYTYIGSGKIEFYPESAFLVLVGDASGLLSGLTLTPTLYKSETASDVVDFSVNSKTLILKSGDNYADKFVYIFSEEYKNYLFYFPEMLPITITVKP